MKRFFWMIFGALIAISVAGWALLLLPMSGKNRRDEDKLYVTHKELASLSENPTRLPTRQYIERLTAFSADAAKSYQASVEMMLKYDNILETKRIMKPGITAQEFKALYAEESKKLEKELGAKVYQPYSWENSTALPADAEMPLVEKRIMVIHAISVVLPAKSGARIARLETRGVLQPGYSTPAKSEEAPPDIPPGADIAVRLKPIPIHVEFECYMQSLGRHLADMTRAGSSNLLIAVKKLEFKPVVGTKRKDPKGLTVRVVMDLDVLDPEIYRR
ncbi:MAG TPA: hypothetical protein PL033_17285 [Candidatus Brocadiia bacterium]|nr:hypothetical protein [Candidatus Brocadiia bacterium]